MRPSRREALAQYAKNVSIPILNTDPVKWPIGSGRAGAACQAELAEAIIGETEGVRSLPHGIEQTALEFGTPTRIWRMSHHLLRSIKQSGASKQVLQDTMGTLLEVASRTKAGPLYNDDGYNIVLADSEAYELSKRLESFDPFTADGTYGSSVLRLAGLLWSYTELLYFVAHEVGVELHGLYPVSDGKRIFVRDFFNLQPVELWPGFDLATVGGVRIVTSHSDDLDVEFDIYNNHYPRSRAGFRTSLIRAAVIDAEGDILDLEQVRTLTTELADRSRSIHDSIESLSEIEQAKKYVEIFWLRKRPFADVLGMDWRPPKAVFQRIDRDGIPPQKPLRMAAPYDTYELLNCL